MTKKLERFGKYLILDHLVDGGMAKICRAQFLGEQANKVVAIKMVQPQYSKNESFVQMFEDELKVTFGLVHPNIAQVYDYGLLNDQLYSAMEYVDGGNLKEFLDRLKEKNFVFPVEISTYIISQVAQALHYAHTFQDKLTAKSFNIIHRDISPHNIMLTYEGAVKVIDFGIAKADSNAEATQAGTIKGKLSYLAPEYLDGMDLDHRYDQFAVGITLWEMLCSRKLFTAKNDLAVLKQIQACKVPKPSSINPNVPPELDEIVLKALSKDRTQRYENMDKLNRALVRFLYSKYPEFNATDLGYFAKQLFKEEITADKKKFIEFGKIDIKPYLEDLANSEKHGNVQTATTEQADGSFISDEQRTGKIELDLGTFDQAENQDDTMSLDLDYVGGTSNGVKINKASTAKSKGAKSGGTSPRAARSSKARTSRAGKTAQTRVKRTSTSSSTNKTSRTRVVKGSAKSTQRKAKRSTNSGLIPTAVACAVLIFVYFKPEMAKDLTGVDFPSLMGKTPVSRNVAQIEEDPSIKKMKEIGYITLNNLEPRMLVKLNGVITEVDGISIKVPLNKPYQVRIERNGYRAWSYPSTIKLTSEKQYLTVNIPELTETKLGFISSEDKYTSGSKITFIVDGEKIEKVLPMRNYRIPAGVYDAVISNPLVGSERKLRFEVKEDRNQLID
jgi:serine/threonine-protein kinase